MEKPQRSVNQIVAVVMKALPEEERHIFKGAIYDLGYTAPELLPNWFANEFLPTFNRVVPFPPTEYWHIETIAALENTTVDEAKEKYNFK